MSVDVEAIRKDVAKVMEIDDEVASLTDLLEVVDKVAEHVPALLDEVELLRAQWKAHENLTYKDAATKAERALHRVIELRDRYAAKWKRIDRCEETGADIVFDTLSTLDEIIQNWREEKDDAETTKSA